MFAKIFFEDLNGTNEITGFSGSFTEITSLIGKFSVSKQIGIKQNGFSITLKKPFDAWNNTSSDWVVFQSEGLDTGKRVLFYLSDSPINTSTDLPYFVGLNTNVSVSAKHNNELVIKGVDYNLRFLSKLWSKAYTSMTASEIVIALLHDVFGYDINVDHVEPTTKTISVFSIRYQPLYQAINQLSSPEYTGETNQRIFFVLPNPADVNKPLFYWFAPSTTYSKTYNSLSYAIASIDTNRKTEGAVNHVIYYAGEDKDGVGITNHVFDPTISASRTKSVWQNYGFISKNLKKQFVDDGTYSGMSNEDFRNYCIAIGDTYARNLILGLGNPRYDLKDNIKGTLDYEIGDLVRVIEPASNLNNKLLRVVKLVQSFSNTTGFRTSIEFKQDALAMSETT